MEDEDQENIFLSIIQRKRFVYSTTQICNFMCRCLCFRNYSEKKGDKSLKGHIYYKHAEEKLMSELDIVTLIKSIKNLRLISQVLLSQRDRLLLRF